MFIDILWDRGTLTLRLQASLRCLQRPPMLRRELSSVLKRNRVK
jgi:hypothetical protein